MNLLVVCGIWGDYVPPKVAETQIHIIIAARHERGGFVHYTYRPMDAVKRLWRVDVSNHIKNVVWHLNWCY